MADLSSATVSEAVVVPDLVSATRRSLMRLCPGLRMGEVTDGEHGNQGRRRFPVARRSVLELTGTLW
jgi:hypothetical protein